VSDSPRDLEPDDAPAGRRPLGGRSGHDPADQPASGAPVGAARDNSDEPTGPAMGETAAGRATGPAASGQRPDAADEPTGPITDETAAGPATGPAVTGQQPGAPAAGRTGRRVLGFGPVVDGDERQARRRRWFLVGISVAAVIVVVALCAGAISVVSAINGMRDRAADARAARELRQTNCLDLERRLNRLTPPGATTSLSGRATAIRSENAAVRIYVDELRSQQEEDAWRQLLDARTVYADALDRQASARTPAFYVAPRTTDGRNVTDELERWSPAQCAGPIHRLAAPEL
jgi:hypothetical protein